VQGKFCPKCGAPSGAAQAGPAGYAPPPGGFPAPATQAGLEENVACALCYLLGVVTGVLFLVLEPYNKSKTVRFHAFQSIFTWGAAVVVYIVIVTVGLWTLIWLYQLACIGLFVFLMYKAYNRERFVLPIIGPIAEKQA